MYCKESVLLRRHASINPLFLPNHSQNIYGIVKCELKVLVCRILRRRCLGISSYFIFAPQQRGIHNVHLSTSTNHYKCLYVISCVEDTKQAKPLGYVQLHSRKLPDTKNIKNNIILVNNIAFAVIWLADKHHCSLTNGRAGQDSIIYHWLNCRALHIEPGFILSTQLIFMKAIYHFLTALPCPNCNHK